MIRECVICGGAFESRQNRKTCSDACHAENRRRHQKEANHRAAQELAAHVSYGQYVAILKDAEARKLRPEEVKARLEAASTW